MSTESTIKSSFPEKIILSFSEGTQSHFVAVVFCLFSDRSS